MPLLWQWCMADDIDLTDLNLNSKNYCVKLAQNKCLQNIVWMSLKKLESLNQVFFSNFKIQLFVLLLWEYFYQVINWNQTHSLSALGNFYIIRSQEKNLNLNRDSYLGPPDVLPGALRIDFNNSYNLAGNHEL